MRPTSSEYIRAALCGAAAASIWAGWIVIARLGLSTSLTPWDITALRFGVGGLVLLPYLLRKGLAFERLGWLGLVSIVVGCGAPMVLLVNAGLLFAPAAHAGGLFSGMVPLMVALLAAAVLREALSFAKWMGLAVILAGAFAIVWGAGATIGADENFGHSLFLAGALLWAGYTAAMRRARLDGLHAAAIAAVATLVLYLPIYIAVAGASLLRAPMEDIVLQGFVHGILTAVLSLVLFGRAVSVLGASGGAAFVALAPVMTALLAVPTLGEWPSIIDWFALILISVGVYLVSGGPLPAIRV